MIRQFMKYNLIQLAAYALDYGAFIALLYVADLNPVKANIGGKIAAGAFAFTLHKYWTFGARSHSRIAKEIITYVALLLLNMLLSNLLLYAFMSLGLRAEFAKIPADMICMVVNFFLTKYVTFRIAKDQPLCES